MAPRYTVYLGLGSNQGDTQAALDYAIATLRSTAGVHSLRESVRHSTQPVGSGYTADFLNSVAELRCDLHPRDLLHITQSIEQQLGRDRTQPDRTLDLDILIARDERQSHWLRRAADPILPHPRMHQREFVLTPLRELLDERTIAEALRPDPISES